MSRLTKNTSWNLNGSDDSLQHLESLVMDFVHRPGFEILDDDVSETGSASIFGWREGDPYSVGLLRKR
jgi:hypothetical protein